MGKLFICMLLAAWPFMSACNKTEPAAPTSATPPGPAGAVRPPGAQGPTVKFHYTLTVDGKVLESSFGKQPLNAVLGSGDIIPGIAEVLAGMKAGDKTKVTVPPEKAYGPRRPEGVQNVPKTAFQDVSILKPGFVVSGENGGKPFQAMVVKIGDKEITLDLNHPLAGKTLKFDLEVLSVQPPKS